MTFVLVSGAIFGYFMMAEPALDSRSQDRSLFNQPGLTLDEGNGYYFLLRAVDRIYSARSRTIADYTGNGNGTPLLERAQAVSKEFSKCFAEVEKGLRLPIRNPWSSTDPKTSAGNPQELPYFADLATVFSAQIYVSMAEGNVKHAANLLIQAIEWAGQLGSLSSDHYVNSGKWLSGSFRNLETNCLSISLQDAKRIEKTASAQLATSQTFTDLSQANAWPRIADTQLRLLRLHMRIGQFHWSHRRLPANLTELRVPEYLSDPIGLGTFQYKSTGGLGYSLWSQGFGSLSKITLSGIVERDENE